MSFQILAPLLVTLHRGQWRQHLDHLLVLDAPEAIQGWSGRWRMHGFATVRNYRSDGNWTAREEAIRSDTQRSAKEKRRQIARERLIKSERIEFEAILSNLDSKPEIDVTLR